MTDFDMNIENDDGAIQAISKSLQVPALRVVEVYRTEFKRLKSQSRIDTYVGVLAMRNTKSILRNDISAGHG